MKSSWISVRAMVEAAELAGVQRSELFQTAGIDPEETHDVYGWIDGERYDRLLCAATTLSGSSSFGLSWGESSPMVQFELIPLLIANAPTLRRCIETLLFVQGLLHERPQMAFVEDGRIAHLRVLPNPDFSPLAARVMTDFSISGIKRLLDYYSRRQAEASFAFAFDAEPSQVERYARLFGDQVLFGQPSSEVVFPAAFLDLQTEHNAELFAALSRHMEGLAARMMLQLSYAERVKGKLLETLPRLPAMEEVARALGMSERSLRRRLASEETSYSELVERSQIERARELLEHPGSSVKSVSYDVGFDSESGFNRAFKRWTGLSPTAYRRERLHR